MEPGVTLSKQFAYAISVYEDMPLLFFVDYVLHNDFTINLKIRRAGNVKKYTLQEM